MPPLGPIYYPHLLPTPQYMPGDMTVPSSSPYGHRAIRPVTRSTSEKLAPLLRSPPSSARDWDQQCAAPEKPLQKDMSQCRPSDLSVDTTNAMTQRSAILQTQQALQKRMKQQEQLGQSRERVDQQVPQAHAYIQGHSSAITTRQAGSSAYARPEDTTTVPQKLPSQAIAPSLQIPMSVNNSQGSLAELAAQITCLFWFESFETLDAADRHVPYSFADQPLSTDAIPSTGFRKWVTTILSTTQVAQNVVILGLLFIYRLKQHNPSVKGKLGSEYRLLTVALMLGNKFLDDNTYTNKTWAEVSGIAVGEVHIMEVEFLSNMKYNLYTSAAEWGRWQTQLGRFASFVDRATSLSSVLPTPILRPTWASYSPSPPNSAQLSPIYSTPPQFPMPHAQPLASTTPLVAAATPTPQQDAHTAAAVAAASGMAPRKRSLEDALTGTPAKRLAVADRSSPNHQRSYSNASSTGSVSDNAQGPHRAFAAMPQMPPAGMSLSTNVAPMQRYNLPQLPPIMIPSSGPALSYPAAPWPQSVPYPTLPVSQSPLYPVRQSYSRQQSPLPPSRDASPLSQFQPVPRSGHTPNRPTTSAIMFQRSSPYRAVREVSTLLVPPPTRALHQPEHVTKDQMHYQPLGRPIQEQQTGRLPYVAQNQWMDGQTELKTATPVEQWPCFFNRPIGAPRQLRSTVPNHNQHQQHQQAPLNYQHDSRGNMPQARRD